MFFDIAWQGRRLDPVARIEASDSESGWGSGFPSMAQTLAKQKKRELVEPGTPDYRFALAAGQSQGGGLDAERAVSHQH